MQAQTVAFKLVAAHEIVSSEVEPRPSIHDIRYDLREATSLIAVKDMLIRLQVAV